MAVAVNKQDTILASADSKGVIALWRRVREKGVASDDEAEEQEDQREGEGSRGVKEARAPRAPRAPRPRRGNTSALEENAE